MTHRPKIVTHNGYFHADELFATATLLLKYPEAEIIRSRDERVIESADIAVDVGQVYNPEKHRFDHHQSESAGRRENGIPYASFGLVWKEFGQEVAGGLDEARKIEERLVFSIDALDNGIDMCVSKFEGVDIYSVGDYFDSFTIGVETMEDFDAGFYQALPLASQLLSREIRKAKSLVSDWKKVKRIYDATEDKRIILLPEVLHWKKVLIPTEALFVISPRPDGEWMVGTVPKSDNTFERKHYLPKSWAGLRRDELARISGVSDAVFCHRDRFIGAADTQEGALKLAEIALNS